MSEFAAVRVCALLPTFDNPNTVGRVASEVREHLKDVIVIDDEGVSHFQMVRDNLRMSTLHAGLVFEKLMRFAQDRT